MANMSYCRFNNTEKALEDCLNALDGEYADYNDETDEKIREEISTEEKECARRMFVNFVDFLAEYDLVHDNGYGIELNENEFEKLFEGRECKY